MANEYRVVAICSHRAPWAERKAPKLALALPLVSAIVAAIAAHEAVSAAETTETKVVGRAA